MGAFIQSEVTEGPGMQGEMQVWEAVKVAFRDRDALGYWHYPLVTDRVREPDLLLLDPELGVVVIEVKSLPLSQIDRISGYRWDLTRTYFKQGLTINPFEQARTQLNLIMERVRSRSGLDRVSGRCLVATPLISRDDWDAATFDTLVNDTPMLFSDQLTPAKLLRQLERTPTVARGKPLDEDEFARLCAVFSTGGAMPKRAGVPSAAPAPGPAVPALPTGVQPTAAPSPVLRRIDHIARIQAHVHAIDLQQEKIGKTIAPGPQRIRGIAGSGKTILLAQKAAHIHVKHPDWDIALVFHTRSLYDQITRQVDHWLREFSGGDITLADARGRLRILHAWGAEDQAGFYRTLADHVGVEPLKVWNTPKLSPSGKLLFAAKALLADARQKQVDLQLFDAVLIDEGQDLVTGDTELHFETRQAFYWLAYQSLRPARRDDVLLETGTEVALRRLVWAYDEAQSLDSLVIPSVKALFGEQGATMFGPGGPKGQYLGGIGKSELMRRCYRTPAVVLTAAHALGMGLLREAGLLSGITRADDWRNIGYEVQGDFRTNGPFTLTRPAENSPHPLVAGDGPLISYRDHATREQELGDLVERVREDLQGQGLQPSRHLLIVTLGQYGHDKVVQGQVARVLREAGINYYAPGALAINQPPPEQRADPNRFWMDGAVTITTIHRAKGNEADSVYVVGLDQVGKNEADVTLRNHLFVAMSRSRGWLHLSGAAQAGTVFDREIQRVIASGTQLTFTRGQPKRILDDEGGEEPERS
jgi:superfamily I DNA and RNA helicase